VRGSKGLQVSGSGSIQAAGECHQWLSHGIVNGCLYRFISGGCRLQHTSIKVGAFALPLHWWCFFYSALGRQQQQLVLYVLTQQQHHQKSPSAPHREHHHQCCCVNNQPSGLHWQSQTPNPTTVAALHCCFSRIACTATPAAASLRVR
jgi:hypothetical protein